MFIYERRIDEGWIQCSDTSLTHISLVSLFWDLANSTELRSDAADCASDQVFTVCLRECLLKQMKKETSHPLIGNGHAHLIRMEKSTRQMWVNPRREVII